MKAKIKHISYSGGDERTAKVIRPHRKDWDHRPAGERGGKKGKVKKSKAFAAFYTAGYLLDLILKWKIGVDSKATLFLPSETRPQARRVLQVLQVLQLDLRADHVALIDLENFTISLPEIELPVLAELGLGEGTRAE